MYVGTLSNVLQFFNNNFMNISDLTLLYIAVIICFISFYFLTKNVSQQFVGVLKIIKCNVFLFLSFFILKYLDLNIKLGVNLLYVYNIFQLFNVLEEINKNRKKIENEEKKLSEKNIKPDEETEDEIDDKNDTELKNALKHVEETEKQIEQLQNDILNNKVDIKNKEKILKEKQIMDEIKKKEEDYMKKVKSFEDTYKRKYYSNMYFHYLHTFLFSTMYVSFYYFFWNTYHNVFILKIYATLQFIKSLISLADHFIRNNSNIQTFQYMCHILNMCYTLFILFFCVRDYHIHNINNNYIFLQYSIILNIVYLFSLFQNFLKLYYKQFRSSLFTFLLFFHIFAIYGMYIIHVSEYGKSLFIQTISLYIISGFGITFGAHRLWSHKAFEAHYIVQLFVLILNSLANQGSVITWSKTHRLHHKYSDTKYDPHNINYGFFYSHIGWLLYKKSNYVRKKEKEIYIHDLENNKLLYIQHKYDPYFNFFICFILPSIYSYYMYNSFWIGFFTLGSLRWVITLHATWSINSFAHSFGYKPYNIDIKPTNNIFTSIIALGEGVHNYHHVFPFCYAMNENYFIINLNPTKVLIDMCYKLGLVWNLRCAQNICKEIRLKEYEKLKKRKKLLSENVNKIMKKEDTKNVCEFIKSFDTFCNDYLKCSTFRYFKYLFRDIIAIACIFLVYLYYNIQYNKKTNLYYERFIYSKISYFFSSILYTLLMGSMLTSIYSLIHECRKKLIFKKECFNDIIGSVLSSFLLLPYNKNKNNLLLTYLYEDFFKIFKGPIFIDIYFITFFTFFISYCVIIFFFGMFNFCLFYAFPYIIFNLWIYVYIKLLQDHPIALLNAKNNEDVDINVLNYIAFQYLIELKKNKYIYENKKKLSKFIFSFINIIHHYLCYTYIIEFISSRIPSYQTKEFYKFIDNKLEAYNNIKNEKFFELLKEFL